MKDLIIKLLACIQDGTVEMQTFHFTAVGCALNIESIYPDENSHDYYQTWQTTCQKLEIVAIWHRMGLISGHDPSTGLVFSKDHPPIGVYEFFNKVDGIQWLTELLIHHLNNAMNILNYDGDPEDLVQYFSDFNLIEKCAWLHRMAELPHISGYHARQLVNNLLNHHDGTVNFFPSTVPLEVQLFAKWMKDNPHNIFSICNPVNAAAPNGYTQSVA